jgi:hypothetical protein
MASLDAVVRRATSASAGEGTDTEGPSLVGVWAAMRAVAVGRRWLRMLRRGVVGAVGRRRAGGVGRA